MRAYWFAGSKAWKAYTDNLIEANERLVKVNAELTERCTHLSQWHGRLMTQNAEQERSIDALKHRIMLLERDNKELLGRVIVLDARLGNKATDEEGDAE